MTVAQPKAILFDWDNTLVDTGATIFQAFNEMLVAMGQDPWSPEYARLNIQLSGREAMPLLFGDRAAEAEALFYKNVMACHLDNLKPQPGAFEMLSHLSESEIPLGIVSNKRGDVLRLEVSHLGWEKWFGPIVGAGDSPKDKPAADPILHALGSIALSPSPDIWMVGDMPVDWACAQAAGCLAIAVGNHPEQHKLCDISVADCDGFKKFFLRSNSFLGL
jgi:phosphoglycolate phosphatase